MNDLLTYTSSGWYCEEGGFYVDPEKPVNKAIITHAHADHARPGMGNYLAHEDSASVMRLRLGRNIKLQTLGYGESISYNGVKISLHPAGHIIGSAQIRIERGGEVWVISGDYKTAPDKSCTPFEPIPCHTFVTESTFGIPFFNWSEEDVIFQDMQKWWLSNASKGICSVLYCYSLGKAQRILQSLNQDATHQIYCDSNIAKTNAAIRDQGISLKETKVLKFNTPKSDLSKALVMMPPGSYKDFKLQRLFPFATSMASGWMLMKKNFYRSVNKGFALSDHADFIGLNQAVKETGAQRVYCVHGYVNEFARHLSTIGLQSFAVHSHKKIIEAGNDCSPGVQLDIFS